MSVASTFDRLVEKYHQFYSSNPEYNYFLDEIMSLVKKGKILDLGCGTGVPIASELTKHGYEVVGVDLSKKMVEAAKINVPKAHFICDDMLKIDLPKDSYDGAIAFFSINHLKRKEVIRLFERLIPAIRENGGILIGTIEGDFEGDHKILGESTYMRHTREDEITALLKGFEIVKIERREFVVEGEALQNQLFMLARKKTAADLYDEEFKKEEEKLKEKATGKKEKKETPKIVIKKIDKKEDDEDEDELEAPLIKISLFKGKR